MAVGGNITFVLGGARSGKSAFALGQASALTGKKAYIATARALDDEMRARIERHRQERTGDWETFEEPVGIAELILKLGVSHDVILVDCLTLWLTNIMLGVGDAEAETERLVKALVSCPAACFVVANEVGLGIVPDNALSRQFRDLAGTLNQRIATIADTVCFVAAGLPLQLKGKE
jgi:adenosylcobinamide kinase/adenosylcobinamide-phosphate guanylyltransferase